MSLARYVVYYAPIEHMNGKLQKAEYKCKWQQNSDTNGNAYYYGYRHRGRNISRYAFRDKCRNLHLNPVTRAEEENISLFAQSVLVVKSIYNRLPADSDAFAAFMAQRQYRSFWCFCIAATRNNGGEWPFTFPE